MINAPSLANCNLLELADNVRELTSSGISMFHIDVMDGHYVPNLGLPLSVLADLRQSIPSATLDAHMMVEDVLPYVDTLALTGCDYVSFPATSRFVIWTASVIRSAGMLPGVFLNPSQRVESLGPFIDQLGFVVLMAVEPGVHGQTALSSTVARLETLAALRDRANPGCLIEVDGGVDPQFGRECVQLGADILVTGNLAVFRQPAGIVRSVTAFEDFVTK